MSRLAYDVVVDSEPEREEYRKQRRLQRQRRQSPPPAQTIIIHLSDEDTGSASAPVSKESIIEISDDSEDSEAPAMLNSPLSLPFVHSEKSRQPPLATKHHLVDDSAIFDDSINPLPSLHAESSSAGRARTRATPAPTELSASDEDEPGSLNIAHFAFKDTKAKPRKETPDMSRNLSSRPSTRPKKLKSSDRFAQDFSDAQLNRVLKCVCCDLSWTTRKSASQKLVHLRSCAKKQVFSDETVRVRMTKYLAGLPDSQPPAKDASTGDTYFQEIVRDAAPKKRTRRVEVSNTVMAPSVVRTAILHRAETLLGRPSTSKPLPEPSTPIPATQTFAPSKFGGRPAWEIESDSDADDSPFPATQAFGPSKFQSARSDSDSPSIGSDHSSSRPEASRVFPSPSSLQNKTDNTQTSPFHPSSSSAHYPTSPLTSHVALHPDFLHPNDPDALGLYDDIYNSNDDGALLHFEPESPRMVEPIASQPSTPSKNSKVPKRKPKKSPVKTTTLPKWKEDEFDENWETEMKRKIQTDKDLYFRILRYEPIHFDVFLELATVEGRPVSGMLKYQVRVFLDKQAIAFFGGESSWRR